MLNKNEDFLICDLAEYYHIYNYRDFPASYIATLASGLREEARIKMEFSDYKVSLDTLIRASIADSCSFLAYCKTEDAYNGGFNRPDSLVAKLTGRDKHSNCKSFASPEDFERARAELIGG